jgi:hypothetical protein
VQKKNHEKWHHFGNTCPSTYSKSITYKMSILNLSENPATLGLSPIQLAEQHLPRQGNENRRT